MYLISACLCGVNCKYSGGNNLNKDCMKLLENNEAILICPEQLGGLATPREPSEIRGNTYEIIQDKKGEIVTRSGKDVTNNFIKGAKEVLKIAKESGIKAAILKDGSPSCGSRYIYDGTFSGNKIKGEGITCKMLREEGIDIISDKEYSNKLEKNKKLIFLSDYTNDRLAEEDKRGNLVYSLLDSDNEIITELPPRVEEHMKELMVIMAEEMLGLDDVGDISEATGISIEDVKNIFEKKE